VVAVVHQGGGLEAGIEGKGVGVVALDSVGDRGLVLLS
jgi:hypothetical protein